MRWEAGSELLFGKISMQWAEAVGQTAHEAYLLPPSLSLIIQSLWAVEGVYTFA